MSLPSIKPAQLSIRSFFQTKTPKYAPPPSQLTTTPAPPPLAAKPEPSKPVASSKDIVVPPLPANLPREASIRPITAHDINALRRINALLLPVSYPDNFYQKAVDNPLSRVITWAHDGAEPKVVGGVVCRVEPPLTAGQGPQNLYIQSLCLLSPYRSLGLVNAAVENIIATAVALDDLDVRTVTAHVWTENEEGLKWYQGRGFDQGTHPIQGYYLKLRPDSAWLVTRDVGASVRNSLPSTSTPPLANPVPESTTAAVVNLPPISGPPKAARPPPSRTGSGQSYQNKRAETEWNDLPEDMAPAQRLAPPRKGLSEPPSGASSRSSSTARKKRDRSYPAAAFGN